jgi:hypothetical protein
MTNLFIITGGSKIYGTYFKTICFEQSFTNEEERRQAQQAARATVCSYALSFGIVHIQAVAYSDIKNSQDVFDFLESKHPR